MLSYRFLLIAVMNKYISDSSTGNLTAAVTVSMQCNKQFPYLHSYWGVKFLRVIRGCSETKWDRGQRPAHFGKNGIIFFLALRSPFYGSDIIDLSRPN